MGRKAQAGTALPAKVKSVTIPAIVAGADIDVALAADSDYAGIDGVLAMPTSTPEANVGVVGAWVSNATTGVITIRLAGAGGAVAGSVQNFLFIGFEAD